MADSKGTIFEFDNFRLDVNERLFTRDGRAVELSSKAFDLLLALVENSGRLVEKRELFNRLWAGQFVEDSNLTVHMSAIRKALGDGSYIKTIKGHGYRFVADVREKNGPVGGVEIEKHSTQSIPIENGNVVDSNGDSIRSGVKQRAVGIAEPGAAPVTKRRNFLRPIIAFTVVAAIAGIGVYVWQAGIFGGESRAFQFGSIKRLSTNGRVTNAALSPDGKLFVYTVQEKDGRQSLRLGHVEGTRDTILLEPADTTFFGVSFSADGGTLYFSQSRGPSSQPSLYKLAVFGGAPEKLSINISRFFAFSPVGDQIAFFRNDRTGERSVLCTADLNGENEREIAARPISLAFVSTSLAWSPDGKSLAVAAVTREDGEQSEVFTVTVIDGALTQVSKAGWRRVRSLAWLRHDTGLLAVGISNGPILRTRLWHLSLPNGEVQGLGEDLDAYGGALGISNDGQSVLTIQSHNQSNIWLADFDSLRDAKQITSDALGKYTGWSALEWTPDNRIIFTAMAHEIETLWIMNADGSNRKQLLPSDYTNSYPSITDDGRWLIFQSDKSGSNEVWRANPDGSDLRQLTTSGANSQPHVSPDGKWIVFVSRQNGRNELMKISVDGGEAIRLAENANLTPRVSPDGKLVAYGYGSDEQLKLAVISIDGGAAVKVFSTPRLANFTIGIRWSPDGKFIAYRDWANGLWKQRVEGGEPERIAGLPEEKLYAYGWSPDGKRFAFTRGQEIRDVVLLSPAGR